MKTFFAIIGIIICIPLLFVLVPTLFGVLTTISIAYAWIVIPIIAIVLIVKCFKKK